MKRLLAFSLVFIAIAHYACSQDVMTLRSGEEVKAVVTEINNEIIKFRNFDDQSGIINTIEKSKVFMIRYENGTKEVFELPVATEPLKVGKTIVSLEKGVLTYAKPGMVMEGNELLIPDEVQAKYQKCPEALKYYNKGRKLIKTGQALGGAGLVISLGFGLLVKDPSMTASLVAISAASAGLIGSITTTVAGRKKIKRSVELYNSSIQTDDQ